MDYYSEISLRYNELYEEEQSKKVKILIDKLEIKNDKVLDVGCGTALYSSLFKNYTGIDNSKGMLSKTKANVIYGNAEELPFKDKSFDAVICVTAIHNFNNFKKAIHEMKRVAKKKVGITVLKRSIKLDEVSSSLKEFNKVEEDKDIIFYLSLE